MYSTDSRDTDLQRVYLVATRIEVLLYTAAAALVLRRMVLAFL